MLIYLMRHAEAVPEDQGLSDRDRYLTRRGREAARIAARLLKAEGVELDAIVTSPLPRAVQTAELVADGLDYIDVVEALAALAPGAHPRVALGELPSRGNSILVVGHEPGISMLGALLIAQPSFATFNTAQIYALDSGKPTFTVRPELNQTIPYHIA